MQIRRQPPITPIDITTLRFQSPVPDAEPRHILEEIVWEKEREIERLRERLPLQQLRQQVEEAPPVRDFLAALKLATRQPALIAELKKASPSKGVIREDFNVEQIARAYATAGAACLSVLADRKFFQGSYENIAIARQAVALPLLCKEFIIYPYQIYLARRHGADAVLLIAAILSDRDLNYFLKITRVLGMTALVEVHSREELERVLSLEGATLVGINNRDLTDFSVDLQTTCQLLAQQGETLRSRGITIVSESGLHRREDLEQVRQAGAEAVLIGESLLVKPDPQAAIASLYE